jgi:hypothetical protein
MDTSQSPPPNDQRHEGDVIPVVSKDPPTAEGARSGEPVRDPNAERDSPVKELALLLGLRPVIQIGPHTSPSPPPNDQRHEGDVIPLVSKDPPTAEEARSGEPVRDPNAERDSPEKDLTLLLGLPPLSHEGDVVPLVSKDPPTAEKARSGEPVRDPNAQRDAPDQRIAMAREGSDLTAQYRQWSRSSLGLPVEPFVVVPKELPAAKEAQSGAPARDLNATRNASNQSIGMGREGSEPSPGLRTMEASIRMSPRPSGLNDQSASDRPSFGRRTYRGVARFFIMALIAAFIGVAASYWQSHGDKAVKLVRTYAPSLGLLLSEWQSRGTEASEKVTTTWAALLDWLFPVPTKSPIDINIAAKQPGSTPAGQVSAGDAAPQQSAPLSQKPVPAATSTSPELVQQLEAMARDLSVVRHEVERLAATQEQMTHNIASPQAVQQDIGQKKSPSPLSPALHLPPATQEQMTHNIASLQAVQQDIRQKKSPPPLSPAVHLPPPKNTFGAALRQSPGRVAILADWWIPDGPSDGWVYVQGHGDVYRVVPGTPLPGLGPVEQIKGQNGHWVVVTPKGIIVPRRGPLSGGEYDVLDRDRVNSDDDPN